MKYKDLILKEANYASYFDNATSYTSEVAFMNAITAKFGPLSHGPSGLKRSAIKAGGTMYLKDEKLGIVGYMRPAMGSEHYQWFAAKTPFQAATKGAKAPASAPVKAAAKAPDAPAKAPDFEHALNILLSNVRDVRSPRMYGSYQCSEAEIVNGRWMAGIRDWGHWSNPPEAQEEDDEEDYDWQVLSRESGTKLQSILNQVEQSFPNIKFSFTTEEKNWIMFTAKAK